jgi:hypothetical protein
MFLNVTEKMTVAKNLKKDTAAMTIVKIQTMKVVPKMERPLTVLVFLHIWMKCAAVGD